MSLRLVGDVPEEHRKLAKELKEMEKFFDNTLSTIPKEEKARGYVSLAHDWFSMGVDEEGHQLLLKADTVYPGYFKSKIKEHMDKDDMYKFIVLNLTANILSMFPGWGSK